jgi:Ca2+-binding RTX toxin-like protein/LysM repeat protein
MAYAKDDMMDTNTATKISLADYAILAGDVYKEHSVDRGSNDWQALRFGSGDDKDSGFKAQTYSNANYANHVVFAIAGTDGLLAGNDWTANVSFRNGSLGKQFAEALEYAASTIDSAVKAAEEDEGTAPTTFSVTGHSLGGGIAQLIAHTFGLDGLSLDAPGASNIVEGSGYQEFVAELKAKYPDAFANVGDSPQTDPGFTNINEEGSVVNTVGGDHLGPEQNVIAVDAVESLINAEPSTIAPLLLVPFLRSAILLAAARDIVNNHDVDALIEYIKSEFPQTLTEDQQAALQRIHIVVSGDTLSEIAEANDITLEELLALNPELAENRDQIRPGQIVILKEAPLTTLSDLINGEENTAALDRIQITIHEGINVAEQYDSPLVLDLDGDGVETLGKSSGVQFDLDADGFAELSGWAGADDGLLVRDINGNGQIDNGRELFGNYTQLNNGDSAANGFAALADLDSNGDGAVDANDDAFDQLRVWQDANSDGVVQEGELLGLGEAGVGAIQTGYVANNNRVTNIDEHGNRHLQLGEYTRTDGTIAGVSDVWFAVNKTQTVNLNSIEIPDNIAALPNVQGFGTVVSLQQAIVEDESGELQALVEDFLQTDDIQTRHEMVTELLYRWVGVFDDGEFDRLDPSTSPIPGQFRAALSILQDGRKLSVLEAFAGEAYDQDGHFGHAGPHAAVLLNFLFHDLARYVSAQLTAEAQYQDIYQQITFQTDPTDAEKLLDADVSQLVESLPLGSFLESDRLRLADLAANLKSLGGVGEQVLAALARVDDSSTHDLWDADSLIYFLNDGINAGHGEHGVYGNSTHGRISTHADQDKNFIIFAFGGNDRLGGTARDDQFYGGQGNDRLYGLAGNDQLYGGDDNDQLFGGAGDDRLVGGSGDDTLHGGTGNDTLLGGVGSDYLRGDAGNDIYHWGIGDGNDSIHDNNADDYFNATHQDTLIFGQGITAESILWTRTEFNLVATVVDDESGITQSLSLVGWFLGPTHQIEVVQLADGTVLDKAVVVEASKEIKGTDADDKLSGFADSDGRFFGLAGDDTLRGNSGDDRLYGGEGDDFLMGGLGDDTLVGGADNDFLQGEAGNDTYHWGLGDGNDTISDFDRVDYSNAEHQDTLVFGPGITLEAIGWSRSGDDLVASVADGDGATQSLTVKGWFYSESNQLERLQLADGTILDKAEIEASIVISGTAGNDNLNGFANSNDVVHGLGGNDTLRGYSGNDRLNGGAGNDTLYGGIGNDVLFGDAGNDFLQGEAGNDTYHWGLGDGNDTISDFDRVDYSNAEHQDTLIFGPGITLEAIDWSRTGYDLVASVADGDGATQSLTVKGWFYSASNQLERLQLADGTILDKAEIEAAIVISGTAGNDSLNGFANSNDVVHGLGGNDTLRGYSGNDRLDGGAGNDRLYGGVGDDTLIGGAGNDSLQGGVGEDVYHWGIGDGNDNVSGYILGYHTETENHDKVMFGEGIAAEDIVWSRSGANLIATVPDAEGGVQSLTVYNWFSGGIYQINLFQLADGSVLGNADIHALVAIVGTESADNLRGFANSNDRIFGLGGNDYLSGNSGDDHLNGGAGNDRLLGGAGDDTLVGGSGDDSLQGNAGNDTYRWGIGDGNDSINDADTADKGDPEHKDTLVFGEGITAEGIAWSSAGANLVASVTDGEGNVQSLTLTNWFVGESYQLEQILLADGAALNKADIEPSSQILGSEDNDNLRGVANSNDRILGLAGDDVLSGDSGNDHLEGGAGNDTLGGGAGNDTYYWGIGEGNDSINDYDYGDVRNSAHEDTLIFGEGIAQEDIVWSRSGADFVATITTDDGSTQSLTINRWFSDTNYQLERLQLADGTVLDKSALEPSTVIAGTQNNETLRGLANSKDTLLGLGGNDYLYGSSGNDHLDGGAGNDTLQGDAGSDTYYWGLGDGNDSINDNDNTDKNDPDHQDTLVFGPGITAEDITWRRSGTSLVATVTDADADADADGTSQSLTLSSWFSGSNYQVERLQLADGTVLDKAEVEASIVISGTANNDYLYGFRDSDDRIQGLAGNDYLNGYSGDDRLKGGIGNDRLLGGTGNDTLIGGAGNDTLQGNAGNDTYRWGIGDGNDNITDFDATDRSNPDHQDTVVFGEGIAAEDITWTRSSSSLVATITNDDGISQSLTFSSWFSGAFYQVERLQLADGTVLDKAEVEASIVISGTANNDYLYGFRDSNDRIQGLAGNDYLNGYSGDDRLKGGIGNDRLLGGTGNDTLIGGAGNDTLQGDAGNDTYYWGLGDGNDNITDFDATDRSNPDHQDTLVFGEGIAAEDIVWTRSSTSLVATVTNDDGTTQSLTFSSWFSGAFYQVERLQLADGTVLDKAEVEASIIILGTENRDTLSGFNNSNDRIQGLGGNDYLNGYSGDDRLDGGLGNDRLLGGVGNDTLIGGAGDDRLQGDAGNDIYHWGIGGGNDSVLDFDNTDRNNPDHQDTLVFGEGIAAEDIVWTRSSTSLVATVTNDDGTSQSLIFSSWFSGSDYQVERLQLAGGTVLDKAEVEASIVISGTANNDYLYGFRDSDDRIQGLAGNDYLNGYSGDDRLKGGLGNDRLLGGLGNDILIGGAGDDRLQGDAGNDIYHWGIGDGNDFISDFNDADKNNEDHRDTLVFGEGIAVDDLLWTRVASNLVANVADNQGNTQSLTLYSWYLNDVYKVEEVKLADGSVLNNAEISASAVILGTERSENLTGFSLRDDHILGLAGNDSLSGNSGDDRLEGGFGNDRLYGGLGDDTLLGGAGNDSLQGDAGNDTYHWGLGDGSDNINDYNSVDTGDLNHQDTLVFGEGITADDLLWSRSGNSLVASVTDDAGNSENLSINNWYNGAAYQVEQIYLFDGTELDKDTIESGIVI